jgi:hypothetical protein
MLVDMLVASAFEWIKALVAPVRTFSALVIAALIAASTAKNRQEHQLDHDSERLRQQLDHDSERLRTQLEHDRQVADLEAVREVVEEGAIRLHRVAYALDPVKQDLEGNARKALAALEPLGRDSDELVERMKVRLGQDRDLAREFESANEATLDAFRAVQRVVVLHLPHIERGTEPGVRQATKLLERDRNVLTNARERLDGHRAEFIDAAARTVGANLPSRHSGDGHPEAAAQGQESQG